MADNTKRTIAVRPWMLIVAGVLIFVLVGFGGYTYGRIQSLEAWVNTLTTAQATAIAEAAAAAAATTPAAPAAQATAPSGTLTMDTIKGVFDMNVVKFGDASRKVLIVEVTDPSCPYCHIAGGDDPELAAQVDARFKYTSDGGTYVPPVPEIRKLVESGEASYAFIYYPGHANGEMATKALYCAFDQGKFWEAHDLLYSFAGYNLINSTVKNDPAQSGTLADFLKGALDATALKACLDSGKYNSRLNEEATFAVSALMDPQGGGTPTFVINTTRFNGAYPWTSMQPVVDAALK
ncbi:MAG: DsbA family protein [Anaerolineae bacterium]